MTDKFPSAPLRTIELWPIAADGTCSCPNLHCKAIGKHPKQWDRNAPAGTPYGVRTGNGIVVLDLDLKGRELHEVLALVEDQLGILPNTYTVQTGKGGLHLYYLTDTPCRNAVDLLGKGSGVDVRGEGGFVVAAGMKHANGKTYKLLEDVELAYAPESLLILCRKSDSVQGGPVERMAYEPGSEMETKAIENYTEYLIQQPPGIEGQARDPALWKICLRAAAVSLPPNISLGLIQEYYNPRCLPTPIQEKVIVRKLEMAWTSPHVQPLPLEIMDLFGKEKRVGAEAYVVPSHLPERRRLRDPNHVYSFNPTMAAKKECTEISLPALTQHFALHPDWAGRLSWDIRENRLVCIDPPVQLQCESRANGFTEQDVFRLKTWLNFLGSEASPKVIENAFLMAAQLQPFEPVKDYLQSLEPIDPLEAKRFIAKTARDWFNPEITDIEIDFFQKWLIAAVRRGLKPGTDVQTMIVLYGAQGEGKSTLGKVLFTIGEQSFFSDQMPEKIEGRDASHALRGKWCVEFSEMEVLLRNELSAKLFLGRDTDNYRAYGTGQEIFSPRACVFLGTTNEQEFLSDVTGNRRYWPIAVTKKTSREQYAEAKDQLWQAAYTLALDPYILHWYPNEKSAELEEARAGYFSGDAWTELVAEYCKGRKTVTVLELWEKAIFCQGADKGAYEKFDKAKQNKIGRILRALSFKSVLVGSRYDRKRCWSVPIELEEAKLTEAQREQRRRERATEEAKENITKLQSNE